MAKGKKKASELNLDEKLQASLVPIEEQPYKIPDTWRWIYAPSIFRIEYGKGLSSKKLEESGFPVFGANGLIGYYSEYMYDDEQALMSCRGAYSGVMNKSAPKSYVTSNSLVISSENKDITADYICYLFSALDVSRLISGSAQPQVTVQSFEKFPIPLPPIKEQQRIVARIESLFSQLDEAKDKAQEVIDGFDSRRAAILAQAFSGELTEKWRTENNYGMDDWKKCTLKDALLEKPRNGYSPKPVDYETPYKSMTLSATTSGFFRPEYYKYIDEEIAENSYLWLSPGDILIQRANSIEKVGTSAIYTGNKHEFIYPDLMMKLQINEKSIPEYIAYILKTDDSMNYFRNNATGTAGNMPKINQKTVMNTPILLPDIEEQKIIVEKLDYYFEQHNQALEMCNECIQKINSIKKSVLSMAFRGKLKTNDSSDVSALNELKNILSKDEKPMAKAKSVRIPKSILNMLETETEKKIVRYMITNDRAVSLEDIRGVASDTFEIIENVNILEKKQVIKKLKNGLYRMIDENAN